MTELVITELTTGDVDGDGVFDVMMRATKAHLQQEYDKNRLRGPEYSTVYLSGLQSAMDQGIRFLLERSNVELQEQQILLAQKQVELAEKELLVKDKEIILAQAQIDKLLLEQTLTDQQRLNLIAEELRIDAQTAQITAETLNVPKQGLLLDQQVLTQQQAVLSAIEEVERVKAQTSQIQAETVNIPKQGAILDQQVLSAIQQVVLSEKQVEQITAEILNIPKQGALLDQQVLTQTQQVENLKCEETKCEKEILQIQADTLNTPKEGLVLDAQECKLKGEYNLLVQQIARSVADTELVNKKIVTENAQTQSGIAAEESSIGRQNTVLENQAAGYIRLAEQRAAEIMSGLFQMYLNVDEGSRVSDGVSTVDIRNTITQMTKGIDVTVTNTPNTSSS